MGGKLWEQIRPYPFEAVLSDGKMICLMANKEIS
jgi:hypothetical protein